MSDARDMKLRSLEILELPEDASMLEIKTAYQHLKDLYTKGSIAISPIEDEYPEEAKGEIIRKLDEAYAWLAANYKKPADEGLASGTGPSGTKEETRQEISSISEFDGPTLKSIREKLGIDLGEVEFSTKISLQHIKNLEDDKFRSLPEEVFVKGYITAYAKCLGLDVPKVVEHYMKRYRIGRGKS